jgi:CYTH domain-containing protein
MPTEYEFKYAISLDLLRQHPEDQLRVLASSLIHIKQGYLAFSKGMSCRVRCSTEWGKDKWYMTFKQKAAKRVVEIEKKLDERDGNDLWEVAVGKLNKDRHLFPHEGITWELDLFKNDGQVYFILAEIELKEGSPRPKLMPSFLRNHLIYEVPLTDDRFSNKRLGDVNHAKQLYKEILAIGDKDVNTNPNPEEVPQDL